MELEKLIELDHIKSRLLNEGEIIINGNQYHLIIDAEVWHDIFRTVEMGGPSNLKRE